MFFRKKINTPDTETQVNTDTDTQVNTITAQQARNRVAEVISERRQAVVGKELNVIYSKIESTMNEGHNSFITHIPYIQGESAENEQKRTDLIKAELVYRGYGISPRNEGWFVISW